MSAERFDEHFNWNVCGLLLITFCINNIPVALSTGLRYGHPLLGTNQHVRRRVLMRRNEWEWRVSEAARSLHRAVRGSAASSEILTTK